MKRYIKKGYSSNSAAPTGNKYAIGNKSNLGRKHTEETKAKMKKSQKGMKGQKHSEYSKAKMRISHIKFMKSGNLKTEETSIEKKIRIELKKRNINFIPQFPIQSVAIVDFYIPEYNIIIQCDGDFWHHSIWAKKHNKPATDKKQNLFFIKKGYKVFRFTETKINKSPKKCIEEVLCYEK